MGRQSWRGGRPAAARTPRRRAGRRRGLAGRPVLGGDPGRLRLGPRRGRHEGLRRDAALGGAGADPGGRRTRAAHRAVLHRGRGGRRPSRRAGARRGPPRASRALHGGRRRGGRLQYDGPRAAAVPDRGGREGHGLDEADRPRPGRARLDDQRRQRRQPAVGRGRADRRPRVAGAADADDADPARHGRRAGGHRGDPRERRVADRRVRRSGPDDGCGHPQHREPDDARAPATRST